MEFKERTGHGIIEAAKKSRPDWQNNPLYVIHQDMTGKKGVETGELGGDLTDRLD